VCFVTYPCEVLSQWDEEGHRAKDLLGLHLRGEHHEFTQLHHALNLKQEGALSHDYHSKSDDEYRAKDLLGLHLRGERHEFTQLHHAFNLKQKETVSHEESIMNSPSSIMLLI
jgi:hypothetical protein